MFDITIHQLKYFFFNYLNSTMEALREKLGIDFDMILTRSDGQSGDGLWVNIYSVMWRVQGNMTINKSSPLRWSTAADLSK